MRFVKSVCTLVMVFLLPACFSSIQAEDEGEFNNQEEDPLPCWFYQPSPEGVIGAIGIARAVSFGDFSPRYYARKRAMKGLLSYFKMSPQGISGRPQSRFEELASGKTDNASFGGTEITLLDIFERSGYIYAYAATGPSVGVSGSRRPCPEKGEIHPEDCDPEWLCSPCSGGMGGVVGVSYRAFSPQRQYELAIQNALLLLQYTYGVRVFGSEQLDLIRTGVGTIRLRSSDMEIEQPGVRASEEKLRAYVRELRWKDHTLYVWLASPDLPCYSAGEGLKWMEAPSNEQVIGAVGHAGRTASGLLSDQINRATREAIIELGRICGISLKSEEILKDKTNSFFYEHIITGKVESSFRPRVRGLYLDPDNVVHVWVVLQNRSS